jgi:hypothetical protein
MRLLVSTVKMLWLRAVEHVCRTHVRLYAWAVGNPDEKQGFPNKHRDYAAMLIYRQPPSRA